MPITGKIRFSESPKPLVEMKINDRGFVNIYDFTFTPEGVYLFRYAEIFKTKEISESFIWLVPIRKIARGLSGNSFEVDFSNQPQGIFLYQEDFFDDEQDYVFFSSYSYELKEKVFTSKKKISKIQVTKNSLNKTKNTLKKKERELKKAIEHENYERAAELRDEIANIKKS